MGVSGYEIYIRLYIICYFKNAVYQKLELLWPVVYLPDKQGRVEEWETIKVKEE